MEYLPLIMKHQLKSENNMATKNSRIFHGTTSKTGMDMVWDNLDYKYDCMEGNGKNITQFPYNGRKNSFNNPIEAFAAYITCKVDYINRCLSRNTSNNKRNMDNRRDCLLTLFKSQKYVFNYCSDIEIFAATYLGIGRVEILNNFDFNRLLELTPIKTPIKYGLVDTVATIENSSSITPTPQYEQFNNMTISQIMNEYIELKKENIELKSMIDVSKEFNTQLTCDVSIIKGKLTLVCSL